jgi:hypothetical protein
VYTELLVVEPVKVKKKPVSYIGEPVLLKASIV